MAINYYDSFIKKLQEIFMMDHAELDFGIYRIMNQKRTEINKFLEHDLLPQVQKELYGASAGYTASIRARMMEIEQQAASFGASADSNPEYQQLKAKLETSSDTTALQNEVFSHLVTFFSRYYDNGDFISKRRYKDNTYAIPYNGEEVKLYWANADQYYIKSSEYFRNYSFVLPTSRRKVHFVLKDASTEQNNNKTANHMERRFALYKPETEGEPFYEVNGDELNIFFTYELMPKGTKQNDQMAEAFKSIKNVVPMEFSELLSVKSPTDKNANRTLLEKHLTDYTAKNSFDYFIHKDLGGFLRRELDFYIKNEVMLLDDLDVQHIESQLNIIKAIKLVGEKIIRLLAQLEDFQKKLWLKKKFVVQSDYCITLDRVPRELYPEILANDRQREEWVRLFAIDEIKGDLVTEAYSVPLTLEFLEQNPFLVLDTAFFSKQFKHKLVACMENIDRDCNGLLINSENFQALELLQEKYKKGIPCVYIDPPYNTSSSEILYKNSYKHSSWLSLLCDRVKLGLSLMTKDAIQCTAIDDVESYRLRLILENIFGGETAVVGLRTNPHGRLGTNGFSLTHEYALFSRKNEDVPVGLLQRSDKQNARYKERDEKGSFLWFPLQKTGSNTLRKNRPTMFYPIYINQETEKMRIPDMQYSEAKQEFIINDSLKDKEIEILPIKEDGSDGCWYFGVERALKEVDDFKAEFRDGVYTIYVKYRATEGLSPFSFWDDAKYSATEHGTNMIKNIFGNVEVFSYPKSLYAVEDCLRVLKAQKDECVIDYFAGSGTTGHAVISLNRQDKGNRKYILVEVNNYFDSATRTRIEKVIYSPDWKDGKPVSRQGISQCFKYMRLEQYEDTLNNLKIKEQQTTAQFDEDSGFKESYMLEYMLDVETRDSLLNLKMFENPFAMTLKTTKDNELVETEVDMVETFNYLIGLNVETEDWYRDENICVVQGHMHRDNLHTLVIWRNCKKIDNEQLNQFFDRMDFRTRDSEFDLIYVNGDNLLPNLRRDEDNWKVVLIEEEFTKRMFETE
ncbi:MAG: DNA methyltransferase [Paraprevotella sp.]|nr:DNA methyltransferase [Paraprevotella sp.]